jgi:predicted MPP superfamily phosphohydrolase
MIVFTAGLHSTGLFRLGRRNALDLRLIELTFEVPELPASFEGYRILHVTDTHLDVLPELAGVARSLLHGAEVDMLALTGDVYGLSSTHVAGSIDLLAEALSGVRTRGPRLAVLGNHDSVAMADALGVMGFDVLVNRSHVIERQGEQLCITGLDDVHCFYTPAVHSALGQHADKFRIALVHSPEMADEASAAGYALYLCGHTHGGQVCLPGGRPVVTSLTRCRYAARGLWRRGRMLGYTNNGLGVARPAVRFNTRGGAALITLKRPLSC